MTNPSAPRIAPDQPQRERALDPTRSIVVQAPAGSGKTDLLTRRFLRLLAEVEAPGQIVAITFTNAAAAEMRNRILEKLEIAAEAERAAQPADPDPFSMDALARQALARSRALGWNLTELSAQLRITTIDAFCREIALQQPLLSGLGGGLDIYEQPRDLYRRASRRALERIDDGEPALRTAIRDLLLWRDNNWQEMEDLLVGMLAKRDRWMHYFVLNRNQDWEALRERLERPFANAVRGTLTALSQLLDQVPDSREEALKLARFACEQTGGELHRELAELADFPMAPFTTPEALEEARGAFACLGNLVLSGGAFRKRVDKRHGFPADAKREKGRLLEFIANLGAVPSLESALAAVAKLPPARYTDEDWQILRACFVLLRATAGELKVVFAEAGKVDFIEVAQIAEAVLKDQTGFPTEAALAIADNIRHLLVDEFQDTSRRQHQLLASLIAAWPEREGRTCFVVGDPMQSIYFFRDAEAELFASIRDHGLKPTNDEPLPFDHAPLSANFRTAKPLVKQLNEFFETAFGKEDGSGIQFLPAEPARKEPPKLNPSLNCHIHFILQSTRNKSHNQEESDEREAARTTQIEEILALIRSHLTPVEEARARGEKYRIAVLGRSRKALVPIAQALREADIPFRAVDLENLRDRPEVLDALALARALLNPHDRLAWLGVLRAPWCGLSLAGLHTLTSADDGTLLARPVPELLAERLHLLDEDERRMVSRVLAATASASVLRSAEPTASLGTWLQQVWLRLGGEACADASARANLDLLWNCLDRLPSREQDLLGPALDAALQDLNAEPDPGVSGDHGVQLMTIHKSKGLEFEVVIVPELQAPDRASSFKMLSWLERGLAEPDESGEISEFLIAPFQTKGADRGKAKEWVDAVYREREQQETRRILYVAATRAREELHFFARPVYKTQKDGSLVLAEPSASLLATAWPALRADIKRQFDDWLTARAAAQPEPETLESLAASTENNLLVMSRPLKPTPLRRLPADFRAAGTAVSVSQQSESVIGQSASQLYVRHEGGRLSRALGDAVHALLEDLARLRATIDWEPARIALQSLEPRIIADLRSMGLAPAQAASVAARAMRHALDASTDPTGAWILAPHPQAASEVQWAGVVAGELRSVRVDRVFQAGATPQSEGEACWWIVDYKTAHPEGLIPADALPGLRQLFAPQLETYAQVLRSLHGDAMPIRTALYYPLMQSLDWWEPEL